MRPLRLFHQAVKTIPAYKDFLKKSGIIPGQIKTMRDFARLPVMNKQNYVLKYPLKRLFPEGQLPPMAYASSGSSGQPTFWFRGDEQEKIGGIIHEKIFREIFGIKKHEPTLVIICFSMGVWVAGNYTLAACRRVARKGYNLTVITPGIEKEDVLNTLKELSPRFKSVVLAGYPPFVMDLIVEAKNRDLTVDRNLKFLTAGDKFSEDWRDKLMELVGNKNRSGSLVSIYGSADAGVLGFETPLTIFLRKFSLSNRWLYEKIFGDDSIQPALVQYDPDYIFFEGYRGELLFTVKTGTPLVRYNIHDLGKIIPAKETGRILKDFRLVNRLPAGSARWLNYPLLVLRARTDVAVTFYALNIPPEHLKAGIENKTLSPYLTGRFIAYNKTERQHTQQKLIIKVELAKGVTKTKRIGKLLNKSIVENLLKLNMEYRKLYRTLGDRALPRIQFANFGSKNLASPKFKAVLALPGKKPKVVGIPK